VGDVVINSGNTLYGMMGGPLYDTMSATGRPLLLGKTGCSAVLDVHLAFGFTIDGLSIDGRTRAMDGISSSGVLGNIRNCTVLRCNNGLGGGKGDGYSRIMRISTSVFSNCRVGISSLIDSTVAQCATSTNERYGMYMGNGAGSNNFVAHRSEWNGGYGILLDTTHDLQFIGGMLDRGAGAGLCANGCLGLTLTGMVFRRSAASNITSTASGYRADCHAYFENCNEVMITGCRMRSGADDGGGGNLTPKYALRFGSGNKNFSLTGSSLSGRTVASMTGTFPTGFSQQGNIGM
jgi:hypothetical protein